MKLFIYQRLWGVGVSSRTSGSREQRKWRETAHPYSKNASVFLTRRSCTWEFHQFDITSEISHTAEKLAHLFDGGCEVWMQLLGLQQSRNSACPDDGNF